MALLLTFAMTFTFIPADVHAEGEIPEGSYKLVIDLTDYSDTWSEESPICVYSYPDYKLLNEYRPTPGQVNSYIIPAGVYLQSSPILFPSLTSVDHWEFDGFTEGSVTVSKSAEIYARMGNGGIQASADSYIGLYFNTVKTEDVLEKLTSERTLTIRFVAKPESPPLTVKVKPAGAGSATFRASGESQYRLTAVANPGWFFDHWDRDGTNLGTDGHITVTPAGSKIYKAVFAQYETTKAEGARIVFSGDPSISPYAGSRGRIILPFTINHTINGNVTEQVEVYNGETKIASESRTTLLQFKADQTNASVFDIVDPVTSDMTQLTAKLTISQGSAVLGDFEYTIPVTVLPSEENSDFRYLTTPLSEYYYAFIADKGPDFGGFYAQVDDKTGALTLYGYATYGGDFNGDVFVFGGKGSTDFVKVVEPSDEILSHYPGVNTVTAGTAPDTTELQDRGFITTAQDHAGNWYALTRGRIHKSSDPFNGEPYTGADVYKWNGSEWKYQVMTDFNDPNDKGDESQVRIRPDGVDRMEVPIDGVTLLFGNGSCSQLHGYSGTGAVYLYTADRKITFQSNGGSAVEPLTAPIASTITAPVSPKREGYTFAGWYLLDDFMQNGPSYTFGLMPAKDITLYAKWTEGSGEDIFKNEKTSAKETLQEAEDRLSRGDYEPAVWTAIEKAVSDGKAAIDKATTYDGVSEALYAALASVKELAGNTTNTATVAVTVEKFTVDGNYVIEPTLVRCNKNEHASVVLTDFLKNYWKGRYSGTPYTITGDVTNKFYLSGLWDGTTMLSEFDHGKESGWVYCVNNSFPGVGASAVLLKYGDVMRWQYTCTGYGADVGNDGSPFGGEVGVKVADKDKLIWKMAEINDAGDKAKYPAYDAAMSVLRTITASQDQVDAALDALVKKTDLEIKDLSTAKVTPEYASATYTGKALEPKITVTFNGKTLVKDTDYSVSYSNNTNAGTATVTVTGMGMYTGSAKASFTIKGISLAKASVTAKAQNYTGSKLTPEVTVKLGGQTLRVRKDYTVSYSKNLNVGTATVTITGKGNYTGTAKGTFAIKAVSLSKATVSVKAQTYAAKKLTPAPTVKLGKVTLKKGTDYTVTYSKNKDAGTATVTIKGRGNYIGTAKGSFKINPAKNTITGVTTSKTLKQKDITKKKSVKFSIAATAKEKAKLTFRSANIPKAAAKYISLTNAGKVTVKKGIKAGTYKIKVNITAAATKNYKKTTVNKTIKVIVK